MQSRAPQLNQDNGMKLLGFLGMGFVAYLILEQFKFTSQTRMDRVFHAIITGFLNICAGGAMFYGWKTVPIKDYRSIKSMV